VVLAVLADPDPLEPTEPPERGTAPPEPAPAPARISPSAWTAIAILTSSSRSVDVTDSDEWVEWLGLRCRFGLGWEWERERGEGVDDIVVVICLRPSALVVGEVP
jgi:hypothetical protein